MGKPSVLECAFGFLLLCALLDLFNQSVSL